MNPKILPILFAFFFLQGKSQENNFNFRRKINNPKEGWSSLEIPSDLFHHCQKEFQDLRILSFAGRDTTEIPYLIKTRITKILTTEVSLNEFNKSSKGGVLYVSFELPSSQKINTLELEFEETNFFASVTIEGSENKKDWFELTKDQKIFAIDNVNEHYRYSTVNFPVSSYKYLRIAIQSETPLNYKRTTFKSSEVAPGKFNDIPLQWDITALKREKQTRIDINLDFYQPVSEIQLEIEKGKDFYRNCIVQVLYDSTKTEKGWIKNYETVSSGYLTSFSENRFRLDNHSAKALRLIIENWDNAPLTIKQIKAFAPVVELIAEFTPGDTYLYYGNKNLSFPSYDIQFFEKNIPMELKKATMGAEENLSIPAEKISALFENKIWLWAIMIAVIGVLGYFTLKMMKVKEAT